MLLELVEPPEDVSRLAREVPGRWLRFSDDHAEAMVFVPVPSDVALLHWLEAKPSREGHGTAMLRAVHQWADEQRLPLSCVCELAVVPFYQRNGWVAETEQYPGAFAMWRW